jgi:hypothetical protein
MPAISKAMEEAFGTKSAEKLRAMGITAEKFVDGVTKKLAELPRVQGGISNSIVNAWSAVKNSLASVGETLNTTLNVSGRLDSFANWIGGLAKRFSEASEGTKSLVIGIGIFATALGPAVKLTNLTMQAAGGLLVMWKELAIAQKTVQGGGLIEWFTKLNTVTKANVIGLVAAAVIALTVAVGALNGKVSEQARLRQEINDIETEGAKNAAAETSRVQQLTTVLKSETATREQKAEALKQLQAISPEYFGSLDIEKAKVEDINKAQAQAIALLNQRARAQAAQGKLVDIEKQLLDLEQKRAAGLTAEERFAAAMGSGDAQKRFTQIIDEQKTKLEQSRASINDYIVKTGGIAAVLNTNSTPAVKSHSEAIKEQAKAYRELDQAQRLGNRPEVTKQMKKDIGGGASPTVPTLDLIPENLASETNNIALAGDAAAKSLAALGAQETRDGIAQTAAALAGIGESVMPAVERMSLMEQVMYSAGQAMQSAAANGAASMKDLAKAAAGSAAKVVRAWIMQGVAAAVAKALAGVPFPFNIAAGAAAGAIVGGLFTKLISSIGIPALAEGGIVNKPTFALIGEAGPEAVVPLNKTQGMFNGPQHIIVSGILRGNGTDLLAVIERAEMDRARIR